MIISDFVLLIWLVIGTAGIKLMLKAVQSKTIPPIIFLLVVIPLGAIPLISLKLGWLPTSAISVVLAGIILFWFAILCGRLNHVESAT